MNAPPARGNPFRRAGAKPVINAAGKLTALGGSAQHEAVARAQAEAAQRHVDMAELGRAAGAAVAARTGAEAACITSGAAAGIAIGIAAILTRGDLAKTRLLPTVDGPRDVLLQNGHDVDFGAEVTQMIRLGGGRPVVFGQASAVSEADLERALSPRVRALVYVKSHHCAPRGRLPLAAFAGRGVPLLVDAAAEGDLGAYIAAGADLVTYSGGKAIGGPTCGFIAGRAELIAACEMQQRGIARAMKVGKEQIMGLLAALERYPSPDDSAEVLARLRSGLGAYATAEIVRDRAGRPIERVGIRLPPNRARALVRSLANGEPSIRTRNHQLGEGLVLFDHREMKPADVATIIARVGAFFDAAG